MPKVAPDPKKPDQEMSWVVVGLIAVVCSLAATSILLIGWYLARQFF